MTIAELFAKLTIKPDKKSFDAADKMIGHIKSALLALVAVKTGTMLAGFVKDTTAAGDHAVKLAQKAGTTAEEIQELGYAAGQSGSSMDGVGTTLIKLSKNLYEAANGNKEMAKSFAHAGIAIREADGSLRPAADVFSDVADHIAAMPDGTKKTAAAIELLGKSGADMIPLLNGGSEGIAKLREEARDLGAVISDDAAKSLEEFGDEQDRVKTALEGLRNDAVVAILPTLKEMVSSLLAWVKANREIIKQKLASVIKLLAAGLKIFAKAVSVVVDIIAWMGEHIDLVTVIVLSLAGAMGIFKIASIGAAVASAAAWALANLPLLLMAAAIAAVILIVEDLYYAFTGGESVIKDLYNAAVKWIGEGLTKVWDGTVGFIKSTFQALIDWVVGKIEWVIDKAKAVKDYITGEDDPVTKEFLDAQAAAMQPGGNFEEKKARLDRARAAIEARENPQAATIDLPVPSDNGGNNFNAKIEINGAGSPEETAKAVETALESYWGVQMKKAAAQTGVAK